jgi:molybdopterin-guanine dinucleotide biosynthesis protein A
MTLGPAPSEVTGIVLAGGRASRFGRDKLAEPLDGRPLLHHAIASLAGLVAEILVVASPAGAAPALPRAELGEIPIRLVRDPEPFGGPLVGLAAALEVTTTPAALLVGGDMPSLRPAVLAALLSALDERDLELVLLESPGRVQSLPAALRSTALRSAGQAALRQGERALRAAYGRVRGGTIPLADWTRLDPERQSLRDVDTPADLPG